MINMKRIMAVALTAALCLTGCGKKQESDLKENTTETTQIQTETEETSLDEETTTGETTTLEAETEAQTKAVAQNKKAKNTLQQKNTDTASPEKEFTPNSSGSPIESVSGKLYTGVSSDVRAYASSSYESKQKSEILNGENNQTIGSLKSKWQSLYSLSGDEKFANTGYRLITAYSQLAKADAIMESSGEVSSEDKALYNEIKDDLEANVEIFLNMEDFSPVDSDGDFACENKINQLLQNLNQ